MPSGRRSVGAVEKGSCPAARTASAIVGRNGSPAWSAAIATFITASLRTAPKAQPVPRSDAQG